MLLAEIGKDDLVCATAISLCPYCQTQILMSVLGMTLCVMVMQTVMILMAVTGVSAGQDSREMDTTVQVSSIILTSVLWSTLNEEMRCGDNAERVSFSCQCKPGFTGDGYNCTGL